jgi:hypothetical protein
VRASWLAIIVIIAPLCFATSPALGEPADPYAVNSGVTVEANVGITYAHITVPGTRDLSDDRPYDSDRMPGYALAIGGWVTPRLAVTLRYEALMIHKDFNFFYAVVGPHAQYWLTPHLWVGGGVGLAMWFSGGGLIQFGPAGCDLACSMTGPGLDLRGGYSFGSTRHRVNVSLEISPSWMSVDQSSGMVTGVALFAGYQHL